MLLRDGQICHKCLNGTNLWGVVHRCYRGSVAGSAASAWMIASHQRRGTWTRPGLRLIALSAFAKEIFIKSGFRAGAIDVKPNFLRDPGEPDFTLPRKGMLYVGRLSREKGVDVLVQAAARAGIPLRIAGDGPELAALRARATGQVTFLGSISRDEVMLEMSRAIALVVPSRWYEGFPVVIAEAFARGTPVIASALGGLAEIVEHGRTGALVPSGDVNTLTDWIVRFNNDGRLAADCGRAARDTYLRSYTPGTNLRQLESIYEAAIGRSGQNSGF
jgi:glycosyltransferase involved in cell wall biosynthesis